MAITLAQITDALTSTLGAASTITRQQSYDELTESLSAADLPLLQVYPQEGWPESGEVERMTFGGTFQGTEVKPIRKKHYRFHADYYAAKRSQLAEDMEAVVDGIDAMEVVLESQDSKPYFGLAGIKAYTWSWERATLVYNDEFTPFMGARFTIEIWVY